MAIVENWIPPSRENWELLVWIWTFFPMFTLGQWFTDWYPQGKTSIDSPLNIPGKIGWATMEAVGFILLLYTMNTLPQQNGIEQLPIPNLLMAALFTIHYMYRAVISPLFLNPSMSPIHLLVWSSAFMFQVVNATCIAGWLAGYGPTTMDDWRGQEFNILVGLLIWAGGLLGNMYYDDQLREIRRRALKNQEKQEASAKAKGLKRNTADKHYEIPTGGLFEFILYPHYFCEWIEWLGFWIIGGWACAPARNFLVAELSTMTPRALAGRRWYVDRFGKEKIGNKKTVIPGLL